MRFLVLPTVIGLFLFWAAWGLVTFDLREEDDED